MKRALICFALSLSAAASHAAPSARVEDAYHREVDRYFDANFRLNPTSATGVGFHQYDARMDDYSRAGVVRQVALYRSTLARLGKINPRRLSPPDATDLGWLQSSLRGGILEATEVRGWEKNPDNYSSGLANTAYLLMSRRFAPPAARLRSVVGRERGMPAALACARINLKNPPRIFTGLALEDLPGTISFFRHDLPAAFVDVKDPALLAAFHASNARVIAALLDYQTYLKRDLLPRSHGDFRLGADVYRLKLQYDEMVDVPLPQLLQVGYANLRANQTAFSQVARSIDPARTPRQILTDLENDHPKGDELVSTFKGSLAAEQQYVLSHHIVGLPTRALPTVEETPLFERAFVSASTDTPGPYEKVARDAYFNVTPPDATAPPAEQEGYLKGFNRGTIVSTSGHEAMPGHFVQFEFVNASSRISTVRKLLYCGSNSEGWAHYCEQMMLDEGYGGHDPKLRLGQLQDALLRNARFIVGISLHTGRMTYAQAVRFFQTDGYQTHAVAARETLRGTTDPTYLVYTLGKLQILKLRADYQKRMGKSYSLQQFHDAFLGQGNIPNVLIRRALLGPDSGPSL